MKRFRLTTIFMNVMLIMFATCVLIYASSLIRTLWIYRTTGH